MLPLVFDGTSLRACNCRYGVEVHNVNILLLTQNIDGKAGQIVIQLPQEEGVADRMIEYLKAKGLAVEEVEGFV